MIDKWLVHYIWRLDTGYIENKPSVQTSSSMIVDKHPFYWIKEMNAIARQDGNYKYTCKLLSFQKLSEEDLKVLFELKENLYER